MTGGEERLLLCGFLLYIGCISIGSAAPQSATGPGNGSEERLLFGGLILYIVCTSVNSAAHQDSSGHDISCRTSDNKPGSCVYVKRCKILYNSIIKNLTNSKQTKEFIRQNVCGWDNNEPKICCENTPALPVDITNTSTSKRPIIERKHCGRPAKISSNVFGERRAELGNWPWMVVLGYRRWHDPTLVFRCSASLIAAEWLLTAAHCLVDTGVLQLSIARIGDLDLNSDVKDGATPIDVPIEYAFVHPEYLDDQLNYDIGLLRLKYPVNFTSSIQPVCLFNGAKYEQDEFYRHKKAFVLGWRQERENTKAELPVLVDASVRMQELKKCADKFSRTGGNTFTDNLFCAGELERDSCTGSTGGPLNFVNTTENRFYLGGILTARRGCQITHPGLYTKVAKFIAWINEVTFLNF